MDRRLRYLVRSSGDRDRQLMIAGVILGVICLALYINLTIMLSKRLSKSNQELIKNTSIDTNMTSTTLSNMISSKTSSTQSLLPIILANRTQQYVNYTLLNPIQYETSSGQPLNHSLHLNTHQISYHNGHVSKVYLRLFTDWEGNASLYIFILQVGLPMMRITHRYAIQPVRETTEWQTIDIPSHAMPIFGGSFLAVGMQDSSNTNLIYKVRLTGDRHLGGMMATNINANTTTCYPTSGYDFDFAFYFTVVYHGEI